jgi:hypothetical protein
MSSPAELPTAILLMVWEEVLADAAAGRPGDGKPIATVAASVKAHLREKHLIDVLGNPTKEGRRIMALL